MIPNSKPLAPIDVAVRFYRENLGENFITLLDAFFVAPASAQCHVFGGPDYLLLAQRDDRADPHGDGRADRVDPYWLVVYMGSTVPFDARLMRTFLRLMPYPLDRVAFVRYAKDPRRRLRFLKTDQLLKHYGIKT